ncbi:phospholipase domain-containing protein [Amycolatopsis pigmentata]|uniref:Phospholipase domain-containing protein n=1 Tax=Amycolatopsis pigmentata TaxID=450801 RepID=A0ABW5FKV0_9PSEU
MGEIGTVEDLLVGRAVLEAEQIAGRPTRRFFLFAEGRQSVTFTLTTNDFAGRTRTIEVRAGKQQVVTWPTEDGYSDVIITAKESADFRQRFAGRAAEK